MSSVSPSRAPRGTASFSGPSATARLLQLGGVDAVQVEGEAGGGEVEPELLHQPVVAAAAAEDVAQRRVVDLEDRAAVVVEVAQQPEVDLHPVGGTAALQLLVGLAEAGRHPLDRGAAEAARLVEHLAAAPQLGQPHAGLCLLGPDPRLEQLLLQRDEVVCGEAGEDRVTRLPLDPELLQQLAVE